LLDDERETRSSGEAVKRGYRCRANRRSIRWLLAGLALLAAVSGARDSLAGPNATQLRLMRTRKAERYSVKAAKSSIDAGAARVHVAAPLCTVLHSTTDFEHYPEIIREFEQAKVLRKRDAKNPTTDVYVRVPILNGSVRIWAVLRFEQPSKVSDDFVVRAKLVKGNVDRFDLTYRLRRIDEDDTELNVEMLIVPRLPFPGSLVTSEVARAADKTTRRFRDRVEPLYKKRTAPSAPGC
jgi:hypothetical protein